MPILVPHPFSLRQLQYAAAVADTGGFRKAAQLCHVSQPSLSAQLAQLEEALGVRIFERDRRRVLVTPAGNEMLARARRVLLEAEDLVAASSRLRDPLCGTLRIGVIPTVSPYLLPEITPAIHSTYPRLTLHWSEEKTQVALRLLRDGALDAVLLALVPGMEGLDPPVVAEDPFALAGAPSDPLRRPRGPARVKELEGASLLLLEDGHCFRDQTLAFCEDAHVREAGYRATSLATLARMAAGGAGLTLLPELSHAVENRHEELAVRRFARPAPKRTLVLAWRAPCPLAMSGGTIAHAPLVLIDLETEEGVRGRAYLFAYSDLGARALRQLLAGILEMVRGDAVAPVAIAKKLHSRFTLIGREGLPTIAISGLDVALWDALARATDLPLPRLVGGELPPVQASTSNGPGMAPPEKLV